MHARYVRTRSEPGKRKCRTVLYCTVQNSKKCYYLYAVANISDYSGIVLGYQK